MELVGSKLSVFRPVKLLLPMSKKDDPAPAPAPALTTLYILVVIVVTLVVTLLVIRACYLLIKAVYTSLPATEAEDDCHEVDMERLNTFATDLQVLPLNMRAFTLCLRSLYWEKALGSSSNTASKMNELRDGTRKDALVYTKIVLPASAHVMGSIEDFFEYYKELTLDEWRQNLDDILKDVQEHKRYCSEVAAMHEHMLIPLKRKQDEAKVLMSEFEGLTETYKEVKKKLEESAEKKALWAMYLLFIPVPKMVPVVSALLSLSAESDSAKAFVKAKQCDISETAIILLSETMIPAISHFLDGIRVATSFFSVVEQDLLSFQNKGQRAMAKKRKLHFQMMRSKAMEITRSCKAFIAMVPDVRTDLMCIPEKPDDENYVDRWLCDRQKEIRKKYAKVLTDAALTIFIKGLFQLKQVNQPMIEEKKDV
ncbi:hypothetical protein BSL78_00568 [Apostichopus japonicus]|uniref:Uncharacterized protein n=1 Tax=Stichopus japonicus TaxID=307972 RepID=A0A2G8LQG6_STIJA|nr:hypothetical protein BSL78_00568 [Apostichopus japonicus]